MSITVLSDVIVPNSILDAGVRGKSIRFNIRTQAPNGTQQVIVVQYITKRQWEVGIVPLRIEQWQTLEGLGEITDFGGYGMLMQDPKDSTVAIGAGLLFSSAGAMGTGYGVPSYRLYKRYTAVGTSRTKDRLITRPQATPVLKRAGATVTLGAGAGNAGINFDTGTATFVADSSSAVTAVTVGATTQVTLAAALAGLIVSDRLYLAGLTGTHAALLNSLSHPITVIAGSVYTLSTDTAGKTITAAGSGYKYPQASEALTWSGRFYVPVHFATDELDWELVAAGQEDARFLVGPSVLLNEVLEA